jgi:hypothetical protein
MASILILEMTCQVARRNEMENASVSQWQYFSIVVFKLVYLRFNAYQYKRIMSSHICLPRAAAP